MRVRVRADRGLAGIARVKPAIALTFLLAAPAINPIVLVSTAVAFAGQPQVVVARFVGSQVTAVVVGLVWPRLGRDSLIKMPTRHRLPDDTWVAVTGSWVKSAGSADAPGTLAALQVESIQSVTKPARPYEY